MTTTYVRTRLNVDDIVKVVKGGPQFDFQDGFQNSWVEDMDQYVGQTMRVLDWTPAGVLLEPMFKHDSWCEFWYPPQALELVAPHDPVEDAMRYSWYCIITYDRDAEIVPLPEHVRTLRDAETYATELFNSSEDATTWSILTRDQVKGMLSSIREKFD